MSQISIPLMRSTFFQEEQTKRQLADFIMGSTRLSMGSECAQFEQAFASWQECKHAVLVANGSVANLILIQSLLNLGRLKKGDRVGISAVTWATNVMPLLQLGLTPVAIDCSLEHLNVTAETLTPHIQNLQALFITNVLGFCGDIDAIRALCDQHHVLIIEDNCESLGTRYNGTLLGNVGAASSFSFFVGHHMSTIEGGMVCTSDDELHEMLLMTRAHGWDRNLSPMRQQELRSEHGVDDFHARYTFYDIATNVRPTEITGFLGNLQLPLLEETIVKREQNFRRFHEAVTAQPELYYPLNVSHIQRVSNFAMPVLCRSQEVMQSTVQRFSMAGVEVRPVIAGDITGHPFWKKYLPEARCQNATVVHTQGFYFPNNPELTDDEVTLLCTLLRNSAS